MGIERDSGIDIGLGDRCSMIALEWAKRTFANRMDKLGAPITDLAGSFSAVMNFGEIKLAMCSDGVGTKIEIAERAKDFSTLGFDLLAMVVDDLVANGVEPTSVSNILDVDYLDDEVVSELMEGLHDAASKASVAIVGGEIAELGSRISGWGDGMHFNWCATAIGVLPAEREVVDGSKIREKDAIVAIRSAGLRSNGFSMARKILRENLGDNWHETEFDDGVNWAQALLEPSLIFAPALAGLYDVGLEPSGIAHVTGGGVPGNLKRVLSRKGLGAHLSDIFEPHEVFVRLQDLGRMREKNAYSVWNMGNGMILVTRAEAAGEIVKALDFVGFEARVAGEVIRRPVIEIETKGCEPQLLTYQSS
jgi:phosphoribosylformylglycinamidine cyclo-ligase